MTIFTTEPALPLDPLDTNLDDTSDTCGCCDDPYARVARPELRLLCRGCSAKPFVQCAGCDLYTHRWERVHDPNDPDFDDPDADDLDSDEQTRVCARCRDISCSVCSCCDVLVWDHDTDLVEGERVCDTCLPDCPQCEGCDETLLPDHLVCEDCDSYTGMLHPYDYKPSPVFHGVGRVYLGLELELNIDDLTDRIPAAETATRWLGDLGYLKEDSSINGFEIVCHPMTHAFAGRSFPWLMLSELSRRGCTADDAGLHVHVNRSAFSSECHLYRWLRFLYRNTGPVTAIARRVSGEWAAFDPDDRRRIKDYAKGERGQDRHRAVNITNRTTVELRIFASSLEPEEVQAALDFTAATVEYTRIISAYDIIHRSAWEWGTFTTWCTQRQPCYESLVDQINSLGGEGELPCAC